MPPTEVNFIIMSYAVGLKMSSSQHYARKGCVSTELSAPSDVSWLRKAIPLRQHMVEEFRAYVSLIHVCICFAVSFNTLTLQIRRSLLISLS